LAQGNDKHGKASKGRRNYRINGERRGSVPDHATSTKYMRSGGADRMAARKARNHGCYLVGMHRKPADQQHAHTRSHVLSFVKPVVAIAAEPLTREDDPSAEFVGAFAE